MPSTEARTTNDAQVAHILPVAQNLHVLAMLELTMRNAKFPDNLLYLFVLIYLDDVCVEHD